VSRAHGDEYAYNGTRRTRLRKAVIHRDGPDLWCYLCRKPIDLDVKYPSPWSLSIDHYVPQSKGGDVWAIDNALPVHLRCNQSRGNRTPQRNSTEVTTSGPPHPVSSREW
jgi:5-methylcytosine-specific restriction endonuclease McrA